MTSRVKTLSQRILRDVWACVGVVFAVAAQSSIGGYARAAGWELERDVEVPSYAVIEAESTDLNIDSVVLSCELGTLRRGLQLRLYPSGHGKIFPQDTGDLKVDPTVEFAIDGTRYAVQLFFADTFVVVSDYADGVVPLISRTLLEALEAGQRMEMKLQLAQAPRGLVKTVAGTATFNLQAGLGGAAVAALRRCIGATDLYSSNQPASRRSKQRSLHAGASPQPQ